VADSVAANLDIVLFGYFKHFRLLHAWMELNLVHSRHNACVARHFIENISWVIWDSNHFYFASFLSCLKSLPWFCTYLVYLFVINSHCTLAS
jgi:hypothetical protein